MRPEVLPPRTLSAPAGRQGGGYVPWLEVAGLVSVSFPEWQHEDSTWRNWAVPISDGSADSARAFPFDPGRRAGRPGEPHAEEQMNVPPGLEEDLAAAARAVAAAWRPTLHRQPELGLVSALGEDRPGFRRRCLGLLRPGIQQAVRGGNADPGLPARIESGIESMQLAPPALQFKRLTVRVAWYPVGVPPAVQAPELMVTGAVRGWR